MIIKTFLSKINFFKIPLQYILNWNTYINNRIHKRIYHSMLTFIINSRHELQNLDFTYTVIRFHNRSRILNNNEKKLSFKEKISGNYYVDSKRLKYNSKRSYLYKPMEYNKIIKRTMFKQALQKAIPKIPYSTLTISRVRGNFNPIKYEDVILVNNLSIATFSSKKDAEMANYYNEIYSSINYQEQFNTILGKKDYYFPLMYQKKEQISGMMSLSAEEKALLNTDTDFRTLIIHKYTHLIYHLQNNKDIEEFLINLDLYFQGITVPTTVKNAIINKFVNEKMITLSQHLLSIHFYGKKLSYNILEQIGKEYNISTTSYENAELTINPFVEISVSKYFTKFFKEQELKKVNILDIHLVNDSNLGNIGAYFSPLDSLQQTGQKHADIFFVLKNNTIYMDVKAYLVSSGVSHRRLSLFHPQTKLLQNLIHNIPNSIHSYLKEKDLLNNETYMELYREFQKTAQDKTKNYEIKYKDMTRRLCEVAFNKDYKDLPIAISLPIKFDQEFNKISPAIYGEILRSDTSQIINEINIIMDQTSSPQEKKEALNVLTTFIENTLTAEIKEEIFDTTIATL